jgi:hypothetical protein
MRTKFQIPRRVTLAGVTLLTLLVIFWRELRSISQSINDAGGTSGIIQALLLISLAICVALHRTKWASRIGNWNPIGGITTASLGILGYFLCTHIPLRYPGQICMIVSFVGLVAMLAGWKVVRLLGWSFALLLLTLPLPPLLYHRMTLPLHLWSAQIGIGLLSTLPGVVDCVRTGREVDILLSNSDTVYRFSIPYQHYPGLSLLIAIGLIVTSRVRGTLTRVAVVCSILPSLVLAQCVWFFLSEVAFVYVTRPEQPRLGLPLWMAVQVLVLAIYLLVAWAVERLGRARYGRQQTRRVRGTDSTTN